MAEERIKIPYPVLVEGKYDRLRLLSVIDADIYTTDGFGIFRKHEKAMLFRALSEKTKIIVLTDSDGAGKVIRSHISSMIAKDRLIPLYIPKIAGKEKRKAEYSKEGFLGVEGMERKLLSELFRPFAEEGHSDSKDSSDARRIQKTDLYLSGLTGGENCSERRDRLARRIGLPDGMTPNAFLAALNVLFTYDEYCAVIQNFEESEALTATDV